MKRSPPLYRRNRSQATNGTTTISTRYRRKVATRLTTSQSTSFHTTRTTVIRQWQRQGSSHRRRISLVCTHTSSTALHRTLAVKTYGVSVSASSSQRLLPVPISSSMFAPLLATSSTGGLEPALATRETRPRREHSC